MALLRSLLQQIRGAARRRGALAASRAAQARACARARARAIRAEAELARSAALAWSEARALAARTYLHLAQRQAAGAAAVTARRLRHASDTTVGTFLWAAYGQTAPRTPSPKELLEKLVLLMNRASDLEAMRKAACQALQVFDYFSPWDAAFLMMAISTAANELYKNVIPTALETVCPFLGIRAMEFDVCPVQDGLWAVTALSVRTVGCVVLIAGCICISMCSDLSMLVVGIGKTRRQVTVEKGPEGDLLFQFSADEFVEWTLM